jgi:hypothetical protein
LMIGNLLTSCCNIKPITRRGREEIKKEIWLQVIYKTKV